MCIRDSPKAGHTAGVETTTGPLGAGYSNGVGMALAERWLAQRFNRPGFEVVNHFTYAIVSDGDLMEGVASEAASLAGHLHLGKLIYLYDDNSITIDGKTDVSYTEDWAKRFDGYGWHVQRGVDFNNSAAIYEAVMTCLLYTSIHTAQRLPLIHQQPYPGAFDIQRSGGRLGHPLKHRL